MKKKSKQVETLVVSGSGSGGHLTPVIAVANALKKGGGDLNIVFIGQSGDKMASLLSDEKAIDRRLKIMAGKWRRYHGEGLKQLLDIPTLLFNIRDTFYVFVGIIEALIWLKKLKPTAVFIKGGAIGVPLGLAAAFYKIPIVTHDSDARPGLANRIISRWVDTHTVSMPVSYYSYPEQDTVQVGIPISADFESAAKSDKAEMVKKCNLDPDKKTIFIFGGSLGAKRLNGAVVKILDNLLKLGQVVHVVGEAGMKDAEGEVEGYRVLPFIKGKMHEYMAASDIIITRGGATALVEIATVGRPMIIVPNDLLTGGHQTVNAKIYMENGAAVMLGEDDILEDENILLRTIEETLASENTQAAMIKAQAKMIKPNPAEELASILLNTLRRGREIKKGGS